MPRMILTALTAPPAHTYRANRRYIMLRGGICKPNGKNRHTRTAWIARDKQTPSLCSSSILVLGHVRKCPEYGTRKPYTTLRIETPSKQQYELGIANLSRQQANETGAFLIRRVKRATKFEKRWA